MSMNTILFVDDEPMILDGLRRMLRPMADQWNMEFLDSGEKALARLAVGECDVVVTDMRMPGMNGAQLLTEVMRRYPDTIRIVLSGQSEREMILQSIGCAHQFLTKPCSASVLIDTLKRSCALRNQLPVLALKRLASQVSSLPSMPAVYREVISEIDSSTGSMARLKKIIAGDVAMTAKVLQLVNSSFFGLPRRVVNAAEAVSLLGLETIKSLVLSVGVFSQIKELRVPGYSLQIMTEHSLSVAMMARGIAKCEQGDKRLVDDAFLAGMLHDIGLLVLVSNLPAPYIDVIAKATAERIPLHEAEREILGATHADVGAYLLGLWGLPQSIVEAIAFHHTPGKSSVNTFGVLTAVHVADVLDHELHPRIPGAADAQIDLQYLDGLGSGGRLEAWRETCLATTAEAMAHD
jgi:HD-like signal output (HDOD) protein